MHLELVEGKSRPSISAVKTDISDRSIRLHELDGIRGWAAVSVVLYHLFWETFGVLVPGFRNPVTGFFLDGQLAVCLFFVLSGEALSSAFFARQGDAAVLKLVVKRYPRLVIPILATCFIVLILYQTGMLYHVRAGVIVERPDWFSPWLSFPPTLFYILQYSTILVFITDDPQKAFLPFLWTMEFELFGSIMVFAFVFILRRFQRPRLILILTLLVLVASPNFSANVFSCFIAGMIFSDIRWSGGFDRIRHSRFSFLSGFAIVAIAVFDGIQNAADYPMYTPFLAILLVFAVFSNRSVSAFFASPLSRFLGRISFPLYLVQFPVLVSFTSWLIVYLSDRGELNLLGIWMIVIGSFAACLMAAVLFEPVEIFTRYFGNRLAAAVIPSRYAVARDEATKTSPMGLSV
jgi:peptidoglycan/LPS O-acetylase OafA/YrhL